VNNSKSKEKIPEEVRDIVKKLENAGFEAYLVGGVVRDILIGNSSKDWDITTDAKPNEIQQIFSNSFYKNRFGTVSIKTESLGIVEITTYRIENDYSDSRHPNNVIFAKKLVDDLKRRDFTMNSVALSIDGKILIHLMEKPI